eukprot:scaffold3036_cov414-Prasinococcus_capsulatus_cf.AAC.35
MRCRGVPSWPSRGDPSPAYLLKALSLHVRQCVDAARASPGAQQVARPCRAWVTCWWIVGTRGPSAQLNTRVSTLVSRAAGVWNELQLRRPSTL